MRSSLISRLYSRFLNNYVMFSTAAIAAVFYLVKGMSETNILSEIRSAAICLLAMREHSEKELIEKLERKFGHADSIMQAVKSLSEQGLQSDERFAEAFLRMRQRQGKGSVLIKMELRERGIATDLIARLIDESDCAWLDLARHARLKRFEAAPKDARDRAKQFRFLQSRGFATRHIQSALNDASYDD